MADSMPFDPNAAWIDENDVYHEAVNQVEGCSHECLGPPPDFEYICQHPWSHPMLLFNKELFDFLGDQKD